MEFTEPARQIINQVLAMDDRWGKPASPRKPDSDKPSRIISDDCRWHARLSRQDQKGPDGELWDLIELYAYDVLRVTVAFRGNDIDVRQYEPGTWEALFLLFGPSASSGRRPNHGTKWEM
jgi:hypothetical protein